MRLYSNENFPLPVVLELRRLGHDVLTTVDSGMSGQAIPDPEVLRFATSEQRIVLTLNRRHFVKLHQDGQAHAGIVVCTFDPNFAAQAQRIHDALSGRDSLTGKLLRVNRGEG